MMVCMLCCSSDFGVCLGDTKSGICLWFGVEFWEFYDDRLFCDMRISTRVLQEIGRLFVHLFANSDSGIRLLEELSFPRSFAIFRKRAVRAPLCIYIICLDR
jgi:hypothetical protein